MTEVELYKSTFTAIQELRAFRQGAPREIVLIGANENCSIGIGDWSKSSINNGSEVVFMVLRDVAMAASIESAEAVQHGNDLWKITRRRNPAETQKPYWLLSVEFEGKSDGKRQN